MELDSKMTEKKSKKKTEQKNKNNKTKPENLPKCPELFGEKI